MRLSLMTLVVLLIGAPAHADSIDFTQVTFGPTASITIDGLTLSSHTFASPPLSPLFASTAGLGLGIVGGFSAGLDFTEGWVDFSVDGTIESLSLLPYLRIDGAASAIPFSIGTKRTAPGVTFTLAYDFVEDGVALTLVFPPMLPPTVLGPSHVETAVFSDMGQIPLILYQRAHPDAVLEYGFLITGIEYTPTEVPEPATLALIGIGSLLMAARRVMDRLRERARSLAKPPVAAFNQFVGR